MRHDRRWRFFLAVSVGLFGLRAIADEVLVGTAATTIPVVSASRKAVALQNNGPNTILCEASPKTPTLTKGHKILSGSWFGWTAGPNRTIKCICSVAQVTGGGTDAQEAW